MHGSNLKPNEKPASKLQNSDVKLSGQSLAASPAVIQKYFSLKLFQKCICCTVKIKNERLTHGLNTSINYL